MRTRLFRIFAVILAPLLAPLAFIAAAPESHPKQQILVSTAASARPASAMDRSFFDVVDTTTTSTTKAPQQIQQHRPIVVASRSRSYRIVTSSWAPSSSLPAGLVCIHNHEGSYTAATGNGFYGGYQYTPSTWNHSATLAGYGQYANGRADLAPPSVQDAVALHDWNEGIGQIHSNWPNTSRMCGL